MATFSSFRRHLSAWIGAALLLCLTAMLVAAPAALSAPSRASYIVVLKDDVAHPAYLAHRHERNRGAEVDHIYRVALKGYSADLTPGQLKAIRQDPNVDYAESDGVIEPRGQAVGNQLKRVYANMSQLHINESDAPGERVNADIAILDTGVYQHPDLNVVSRVDCVGGGGGGGCKPGQPYDDTAGHGTHVAGDAAAIDNGIGMVGTAPGARIWSVKVVDKMSYGGADQVGTVLTEPPDPAQDLFLGNAQMSDAIAGIDYVTAHSSEIEVANMSFACATENWGCARTALKEAIATSVNNGVVWVAAAGQDGDAVTGNDQVGIKVRYYPALLSDVITVSAMADYDGLPGSLSNSNGCSLEKGTQVDDRLMGPGKTSAQTGFSPEGSNFGPEVDITAPGSCVFSTWSPYNLSNRYDIPYKAEYGFMYGSSVASALVAGAAADLTAGFNPNSRADVEMIKNALTSTGNYNWEDLISAVPPAGPFYPPDGVKEPLLDMSKIMGPRAPDVNTTANPPVGETTATLDGWLNPNGSETRFYFQYGTTTAYGTNVPAPPGSSIGGGTSPQHVVWGLSGLAYGTTYHYRLVASNALGTTYGQDQTFNTLSMLAASTGGSSLVYSASAKVEGTVTPGGVAAASYRFDYGPTTSYGSSTATVPAGTGFGAIPVSTTLSGLESARTYHYRIVATNVEGQTVVGADRTFHTIPQIGMIANGAAYVMNFPYAANGWSIIDSNGDTQMRLSGSMATVIRGDYSYFQNKPFTCCGWKAIDTFDTRLETTSQTGGGTFLAAIRKDGNAYTQSTPLTCCGWQIIDNSDSRVSMTSPTTGGSYVGVVRKNGNAYIQHTPLTCCGWQAIDNNDVQMAMASSDSGGSAIAVLRNTNGNGTGNTYIQNAPFDCCSWSIVDNNDRQVAMARGADGKIRIGVVRTDGSAWVQSAPFGCCAWTKVADASLNVQRLVMSGDTIAILRGNPAAGIVSYQQAPFSTTKWQDIGSNATQVVLQGGSPTDDGDASSPAPPDKDADLVPDTDDGCPTVAGSYTKAGC